MNRQLALLTIYLLVLNGMLVPATVSAEILVGVKAGDWGEYNVVFFAELPAPVEPYPIWRKIEVLSVQGTNLTYVLSWEWSNETKHTDTFTEDIETGVSDALIIPANLNEGDMFYHEIFGSITISEVGERTYAGARRTVVNATVTDTYLFCWDRATGILLELIFFSDYWGAFMNLEIFETNMWEVGFVLPSGTLLYVLIVVAVVIVVPIVFFVKSREKKSARKRKK